MLVSEQIIRAESHRLFNEDQSATVTPIQTKLPAKKSKTGHGEMRIASAIENPATHTEASRAMPVAIDILDRSMAMGTIQTPYANVLRVQRASP
jgi:hypothetical protein